VAEPALGEWKIGSKPC